MSVSGAKILLHSGNYFDFLDPEGSTFTIEDIAHGLSRICRYSGQVPDWYSVAQHSVLVSDYLNAEHAYAGLMHDAAEAFIGDVATPLKRLLPDYQKLEAAIERAVFDRFDVPWPMPDEVREMDRILLATEQVEIMKNYDNWDATRGVRRLPIQIHRLSPDDARDLFLERFFDLAPKLPARVPT